MAEAIIADMNASGIYQIRNLINGKRYVGSAKCFRQRWAGHRSHLRNGKHSSKHMQNAWNKNGQDSFAFEVIELCEVGALIQREQWWLDNSSPEYNISPTAGSPLGVVHGEAFRKKVSERFAGKSLPASQIERMSLSISEAWADPNKRDNMSAGIKASYDSDLLELRATQCKERWGNPGSRAAMILRMREAYTDSRKKRISESNAERWATPEFRERVTANMRGRVISEAQRDKIRIALTGRKPTVETLRKKCSLTDAQVLEILKRRRLGAKHSDLALAYSVSTVTIARICRGTRYQWVRENGTEQQSLCAVRGESS